MCGGEHSSPPLQNRVLPTQEIVSDPARGMFTGNRGILQFTDRKLGLSRWKHQHWIICDLTHPRGRYHGPMPQNAWTPLFFLDEAVGLAAGHRPCAYCRPQAYRAYKSAWQAAFGTAGHKEIDRALHKARVTHTRRQIRHEARLETLPYASFILMNDQPHLVWGTSLIRFTPKGYVEPQPRPNGTVQVLTPAPQIEVLRQGFVPVMHPTLTNS